MGSDVFTYLIGRSLREGKKGESEVDYEQLLEGVCWVRVFSLSFETFTRVTVVEERWRRERQLRTEREKRLLRRNDTRAYHQGRLTEITVFCSFLCVCFEGTTRQTTTHTRRF